jgi:hypothetical protein
LAARNAVRAFADAALSPSAESATPSRWSVIAVVAQ